MERIINEQKPQQQPPSPAFRTLEEKIDELVNGIREIRNIIWNRRKTIRQQLKEIIQLAQDLSIDDMQVRDMIYESCTRMGVSPSWLRKMLPENLKLTKHTRKDYLKRQLQRDQQPLHQQPQQQQKQQEETFTALGHLQLFDNDVPIKVTVNVKTKSIERMEVDIERIKTITRMTSYEKTTT
ncbi:MAG TPA: hypothetical protein VFI70_10060 [Nitrososphaeraceae archaeon]|nr:hypothetical protein [Nitrososphaeraceae archaeon]